MERAAAAERDAYDARAESARWRRAHAKALADAHETNAAAEELSEHAAETHRKLLVAKRDLGAARGEIAALETRWRPGAEDANAEASDAEADDVGTGSEKEKVAEKARALLASGDGGDASRRGTRKLAPIQRR